MGTLNLQGTKWKESGTIPNSFYYGIVFNLSNFLGSLHFLEAAPIVKRIKLQIT